MQADLGEDRLILSLWLDWRQPGLGVATLFASPCWMVRLDCLCFGVALTWWRP